MSTFSSGVTGRVFGVVASFLVAVASAIGIGYSASRELLERNAAETAREWGRYLAETVDLEALLVHGKIDPASGDLFGRSQRVGTVFRYKVYDAKGALVLTSDAPGRPAKTQSLAEHNPPAAAALRAGRAFVKGVEGDGARRPLYYSEAYVPIVSASGTEGVLEVYVDQTSRTLAVRESLLGISVAIGAVFGITFSVPALAFFWRSQQKAAADRRLRHVAQHDGLTGLYNRVTFREIVAARLAARRPLAIHFIDLDRFKSVNDTLGHATGDAVLCEAARRLRDLAGADDVIGRLGGDEFAICQLGPDEDDAFAALAARVVAAIGEPFSLPDGEVQIGASVGTARGGRDGTTVDELLQSADVALYRAKRLGRSRAVSFEAPMVAERRARHALEARLRKAVAENGFLLDFQPLRESATGRLCGFEALLRLRGADGERIAPSVFVPVAEEMGLINAIGGWVIEEAARQAARWPSHLSVSVNLSTRQFASGKLVPVVQAALAATGLDPSRLTLEVTESLLIANPDRVLSQISALKALGVTLALDDFGTGYSSLAYLWRFPFDVLKIDRSFLKDVADPAGKSRDVISAIVALGDALGLSVTAEGIETVEQLQMARQLGCAVVQGLLIGMPVGSEKVMELIASDPRALERAGELAA